MLGFKCEISFCLLCIVLYLQCFSVQREVGMVVVVRVSAHHSGAVLDPREGRATVDVRLSGREDRDFDGTHYHHIIPVREEKTGVLL